MFDQRFLSRLHGKLTTVPSSGNNADVIDDICGHLHDLLNVHKGSVPTRLDYGMMDMNAAITHFSEAIKLFEQDISRQITVFEPRLRNVHVQYVPDGEQPNRFLFTISAVLNHPDHPVSVKVMTTICDDGRVMLAV